MLNKEEIEDNNTLSIQETIIAQIVNEQDEYLKNVILKYAQKEADKTEKKVRAVLIDEGQARQIINLGIEQYAKFTGLNIKEKDLLDNKQYTSYLENKVKELESKHYIFEGARSGKQLLNKLIEQRETVIDKLKEDIEQINLLLNQKTFENCKVRIMPDVHAGKGCVIGFTADLGNKVIPNIVGVDIGCGMLCVELGKIELDLELLDEVINKHIPSGRNIHENKLIEFEEINKLYCLRKLKETKKFNKAIGSLGGGNHFIEIDIDDEENKYLVIHTGSRNLGKQVAEYYQDLAIQLCSGKEEMFVKKEDIIKIYKEQGRKSEIQSALKQLEAEYKENKPSLPKELCYLEEKYREMYLHDMKICQEYASLNRVYIAKEILSKYYNSNKIMIVNIEKQHNGQILSDVFPRMNYFETIHNYISFEDNIVRKGAISAEKGERVLIPINMRDGSIIAVGKGNNDWNNSAPHGAGRIMSRTKAKEVFRLEDFEESMKDIYSTSVVQETIDEAPFVYKPMQEIIDNIKDTVEIEKIIRPIYNFKSKN